MKCENNIYLALGKRNDGLPRLASNYTASGLRTSRTFALTVYNNGCRSAESAKKSYLLLALGPLRNIRAGQRKRAVVLMRKTLAAGHCSCRGVLFAQEEVSATNQVITRSQQPTADQKNKQTNKKQGTVSDRHSVTIRGNRL